MTLFQTFFYVMAALTLVGALGVVLARNVVHAALFLILALAAVAGLYLTLFADFVALVQVLLYGGAVTILMLFAMMLTRVREGPPVTDNPHRGPAVLAASALFAVLAAGIIMTPWGAPSIPARIPFTEIATTLFLQWPIPFEVASLVLLTALVGAVVLARQEDPE